METRIDIQHFTQITRNSLIMKLMTGVKASPNKHEHHLLWPGPGRMLLGWSISCIFNDYIDLPYNFLHVSSKFAMLFCEWMLWI